MAEGYSRSELARRAGVSPDTLRHYEKKGVLPAPPRTAGGYRRYPPEALDRVVVIRRALDVGFTLDELARVLRERARGAVPCREVRALVSERLRDLEARLDALARLRDDLHALMAEWDATLARTPAGAQARLLDALAGRPVPPRARTGRRGVSRPKERKRVSFPR